MNTPVNFTPEQYRMIYHAMKYYQVHGLPFNGNDHKIAEEIISLVFDRYYTQNREQER
jgi:hypothetical protein